MEHAHKAAGYHAPAPAASVFALAEPDTAPLQGPTRCALEIEERPDGGLQWTEYDARTGEVLELGDINGGNHDDHDDDHDDAGDRPFARAGAGEAAAG